MIVPAAGHNGSLRPEVWVEIENWIDQVVPRRGLATERERTVVPRELATASPTSPSAAGKR
jgi:hypothetical protein